MTKKYQPLKQDEVMFLGGIGCKRHDNCFTCSAGDCDAGNQSKHLRARRYTVTLPEHNRLMHSIIPYQATPGQNPLALNS